MICLFAADMSAPVGENFITARCPWEAFEGRLPIGNPYQSAESARELSVAAWCNIAPITAQSQSPSWGYSSSAYSGVGLCLMLDKRLAGAVLLLHQACQMRG